MSKKNQYSAAEKLAILQELKMEQSIHLDVVQKHDISLNALVKWRPRYKLYGYEELEILFFIGSDNPFETTFLFVAENVIAFNDVV